MKKILITGAGSYIGCATEKYLNNFSGEYQVDTLDMLDSGWKEKNFSEYDSVFHVAGIAHSDGGKISREREALYYAVNTDLTIEVAEKAKADGARQFIFMSSAIVYGDSAPIGKTKRITADTPLSPANCYGDSKVRAERGILPLQSDSFNVAVLRPPMIYGSGSRGNYPILRKLALKLPVFPKVKNERSMLYIENLTEFVRLIIDNCDKGIFWPQNKEYSDTCELISLIAAAHGKKPLMIGGFAPVLKVLSHITGLVNKAFGSLSYDQSISEYHTEYRKFSLEQSINKSEK